MTPLLFPALLVAFGASVGALFGATLIGIAVTTGVLLALTLLDASSR